jgi:UDP-N-acetylmuramate: L-alanyl-gamma-D-glutamyl-meso-diaminopimelate ligase
MRVHFIAIGGAAMHNLAIALHKKGYIVSGSDDEIFEPSKTRLEKYNLLPNNIGWNSQNINNSLDAIILGMHARKDNPELIKAQQLGVKIYSFPEFLYEQSKNKIRVVIGGSHGKTSITAMILHVLNKCNVECDYMVGAQLDGFEVMVKLSESAPIIVLEGDEYLTSPIDRRPKFHVYQPTIGLISGIAWDHINVFPTFENYVEQFSIFADMIEKNGALVYCELDKTVLSVVDITESGIKKIPYGLPNFEIKNSKTILKVNNNNIPLKVFGEHNMQNLMGAMNVCKLLGVDGVSFYKAIQSFEGASRRLEKIGENEYTCVYKDFAHSPSKLRATVNAMKNQYPERKLVACMELHTFSSLNANFLNQYAGCMDAADNPIVYFNPHTIEHKKLPPLNSKQVREAFQNENIEVYSNSNFFREKLYKINWKNSNLLMMSSGDLGDIDLKKLVRNLFK